MQLGVAISTLCNYMADRCGNFNFMQLNATICNCVGTKNVYWHDNLSSCFNECRYHQIGICQIYLPRVMKVRRVVLDLSVLDQLGWKR